jgi:hypothetical protein
MMRGAIATVLFCAALAVPPLARAAQAGPWDSIAFEVNSWGNPVTSWSVSRQYGGAWTETVGAHRAMMDDGTRVVHEVAADERKFGALSDIVARLPDPAPDYEKCRDEMTDLPYGTIRLTRGATTVEISWNSGCRDADYVAFLDVLKAADTFVAEWGKPGKVLQTQERHPRQ